MSNKIWSRTVFRLRKVPNCVSDSAETAKLLSDALALSVDNIIIYSLAKASDVWEVPPSRVATLQFKSIPQCVEKAPDDDEWEVPVPGGSPVHVLLLDTHFRGMTALNDVEPAKHRAEYVNITP
jgi:hypothetical protein